MPSPSASANSPTTWATEGVWLARAAGMAANVRHPRIMLNAIVIDARASDRDANRRLPREVDTRLRQGDEAERIFAIAAAARHRRKSKERNPPRRFRRDGQR